LFLNAKVEIAMKLKMIVALAAVASLALCAEAAKYDVAAFVWPAYQPEPRWAELGIFKDERRPIVHGSNPADFEDFARRIKAWADANIPSDMPKLITVNSWNEWTEGAYLEPDDNFGYGYLNALWRVFVK